MQPCDTTLAEMLSTAQDPPAVQAETKRISNILDANMRQAISKT